MKKLNFLLLACSIIFTINVAAQSDKMTVDAPDGKKNELKLNASNLIIFSFVDVAFEHNISQESSLGVSLLVNTGNNDIFDEVRKWSITPYYRQYFSKQYAKGFFVEAFGMLNGSEVFEFNSEFNNETTEQVTDFALGVSVGGKFVTSGGFVAEVYAGVGRNLLNSGGKFGSDANVLVTRGGISLGFRF